MNVTPLNRHILVNPFEFFPALADGAPREGVVVAAGDESVISKGDQVLFEHDAGVKVSDDLHGLLVLLRDDELMCRCWKRNK